MVTDPEQFTRYSFSKIDEETECIIFKILMNSKNEELFVLSLCNSDLISNTAVSCLQLRNDSSILDFCRILVLNFRHEYMVVGCNILSQFSDNFEQSFES
jgi:hypothetical protein